MPDEPPQITPPQITPCPNCGAPWPPGAGVCPNCGFVRPAWPPPAGRVAPAPPVPRLITGKAWGDLTLGIGLSFLSNFLAGAGFLLMPVLYFTLKRNYPVFARGIGYGILAGLALLLGAFAFCLYSLSGSGGL